MLNNKLFKLDIALILSSIPHLLHIKIEVATFLFLCILLLFFKIRPNTLGIIFISFIGILNLWFSYEEYFSQRVILLHNVVTFFGMMFLTLGVILRLKNNINLALFLTPFLMMVFSLHYYSEDFMMAYSLFCIYTFLSLYIWEKQNRSLKEAFLYINKILLFGAPLVIILFIFYPRSEYNRSNENSSDIKDSQLVSGFEGSLSLDKATSINPSSNKAFEVWFIDKIPNLDTLYFRGSVLYANNFGKWEPRLNNERKYSPKVKIDDEVYEYNINLFPHKQKWLYSLDYLTKTLKGTEVFEDRTLLATTNIDKVFRYKLWSSLEAPYEKLNDEEKNSLMLVDSNYAPKLYKNTREIAQIKDEKQRVLALFKYLKSLKLKYTLNPDTLSGKSLEDDFLFNTKEGYCVHFASTFAIASQYVGIPSRVVTGYIAYLDQKVNNYLLVEEKNAHAWSEIYLEDQGWVRVETTNFAQGEVNLNNLENFGLDYFIQRIMVISRYLLNLMEEFIYELEIFFLIDFFKEFIQKAGVLFQAILIALFIGIIAYVISLFGANKRGHELHLRSLLKLFRKYGFIKKDGETIEAFINRVSLNQPKETKKSLHDLNRYYHEWVYGQNLESKSKFLKIKKKINLN